MTERRLEGRSAIVTGACRGIGLAIVQRFLEEGATVAAVDIDPPTAALEQTAAEHPDRVLTLMADVADEAAVVDVVTAVRERFGRLDVLVNNAGIEFYKPVTETSLHEWNRLMDINLGGVFLFCKHAMPLLEASHGAVVKISSELAIVAERNVAAYVASKGAVQALTRALAVDHSPAVRVNSLCPGPVDTELLQGVFRDANDGEALRTSFEERILLGRLGTADDVASTALFLASDESSFMAGAALVLDGGWTAH